jgi:GDP-mannose 6-dehydrogenase
VNVAVFGLGYVGCVSAAGFASMGHEVVGVDINSTKVELLQSGKSPVLESDLSELIARETASGRLRSTSDAAEAVHATDVSLVCVGTPSAANGKLDTAALERVLEEIGSALTTNRRHTVVIRSTVLPRTCETLVVPLLERVSRLEAGTHFGVAMNPEFLREGSSVADFRSPSRTVIGEWDRGSGDVVEALCKGIPGRVFRVRPVVAEMVKYVDNSFHALKIAFANEIGAISRSQGLDSHEIMEIFRADKTLNVSEAYLRPGFAFGGSCLPKDLRALLYACRHADVDVPLLASVIPSNERHLQRTVDLVIALARQRVGILGLAFKPGTDDLRESPMVELAERLLGKGFDLKIYDPAVSSSKLVGANREYIERRIPHLDVLMADTAEEVMQHAEVCVIGAAGAEEIDAIAKTDGRVLVDLVRLPDASSRRLEDDRYLGVAW